MGRLLRRQPAQRMGPHGKALLSGGFLKALQVKDTPLRLVGSFQKTRIGHIGSRKRQTENSLWILLSVRSCRASVMPYTSPNTNDDTKAPSWRRRQTLYAVRRVSADVRSCTTTLWTTLRVIDEKCGQRRKAVSIRHNVLSLLSTLHDERSGVRYWGRRYYYQKLVEGRCTICIVPNAVDP